MKHEVRINLRGHLEATAASEATRMTFTSLLVVIMACGAARALENPGQNLYAFQTDLKKAADGGGGGDPPAFPPVSSHILQTSPSS